MELWLKEFTIVAAALELLKTTKPSDVGSPWPLAPRAAVIKNDSCFSLEYDEWNWLAKI